MILDFIFLTITYSAGYLVVFLVTTLSIISFLFHRHSKRILPLLLTIIGSGATVYILKNIFNLPRPDSAFYLESSASFPSGHASLAIAIYGFLFLTIWKHDHDHIKNKSLILLGILIIAIGFSRIYLRVHYLEDVLVGYSIGIFWLYISTKFFPAYSK